MRTLIGFCFALLVSTALPAQTRGGFAQPMPGIMGAGSVVHPGGTTGMPGVLRTTGSVVHPGGSTPQIVVPGIRPQGLAGQRRQYRNGNGVYAYPYAYPVYVGGYGYGDGYDAPPPAAQQPAPNVIVIYPQAPVSPAPAQIYYAQPSQSGQPSIIELPGDQQPVAQDQAEATHYLIAFKDHSIYSAVAYWVDGDTLHYFTNGNTHNQVSVSLVDRELTKKLDENSGLDVKLPPAK